MMKAKTAAFLATVTLFIVKGGFDAEASEPFLCNPRRATLEFTNGESRVTVGVSFRERNSLCTLDYERLGQTRPNEITIRFREKEYKVEPECVARMVFDLHGVTVDFGEDDFVVWFMESHKAVPDLREREKKSVGVWFERERLYCSYFGEFLEFGEGGLNFN